MAQPPRFIDHFILHMFASFIRPLMVLSKPLVNGIMSYATFFTFGFTNSHVDTSMYVHINGGNMIYLVVYIDDILLQVIMILQCNTLLNTQPNDSLLRILGLSFFLSVKVAPYPNRLFLSQQHYIGDLLTHTKMTTAKANTTPIATNQILTLHLGITLPNPAEYCIMIGSLRYLLLT